jgi:carbon storage regulator
MLVLSRKLSQQIMIGSDIRITVVKIERNQVRIGIEAPDEVAILRGELLENFLDDEPAEDDHATADRQTEVFSH